MLILPLETGPSEFSGGSLEGGRSRASWPPAVSLVAGNKSRAPICQVNATRVTFFVITLTLFVAELELFFLNLLQWLSDSDGV